VKVRHHRDLGIGNAWRGMLRRRPAQEIVGREDAKRDHRQEDENERKRKRAQGELCVEGERNHEGEEQP
jgi:NADH:ubiquinone oxidoreductase subunit